MGGIGKIFPFRQCGCWPGLAPEFLNNLRCYFSRSKNPAWHGQAKVNRLLPVWVLEQISALLGIFNPALCECKVISKTIFVMVFTEGKNAIYPGGGPLREGTRGGTR